MRRWLKVGAAIGIATLRRLRSRNLEATVLPPWFDVDRPDDLKRLRELLGGGLLSAPETSRVLAGRNSVQGLP